MEKINYFLFFFYKVKLEHLSLHPQAQEADSERLQAVLVYLQRYVPLVLPQQGGCAGRAADESSQ